jgi:hypothetical protein
MDIKQIYYGTIWYHIQYMIITVLLWIGVYFIVTFGYIRLLVISIKPKHCLLHLADV